MGHIRPSPSSFPILVTLVWLLRPTFTIGVVLVQIEKGLRTSHARILDVAGLLAQILTLADNALRADTPLNLTLVQDWVQRAGCLLQDLNSAVSAEHRCSSLLRRVTTRSTSRGSSRTSLGRGHHFWSDGIVNLGEVDAF